jgi:hypothetical protein
VTLGPSWEFIAKGGTAGVQKACQACLRRLALEKALRTSTCHNSLHSFPTHSNGGFMVGSRHYFCEPIDKK